MAGSGGTPLMICSRLGVVECVQVLLDGGAKVDALAEPSAAFVAEIETLQTQTDEKLSPEDAEQKRQRGGGRRPSLDVALRTCGKPRNEYAASGPSGGGWGSR